MSTGRGDADADAAARAGLAPIRAAPSGRNLPVFVGGSSVEVVAYGRCSRRATRCARRSRAHVAQPHVCRGHRGRAPPAAGRGRRRLGLPWPSRGRRLGRWPRRPPYDRRAASNAIPFRARPRLRDRRAGPAADVVDDLLALLPGAGAARGRVGLGMSQTRTVPSCAPLTRSRRVPGGQTHHLLRDVPQQLGDERGRGVSCTPLRRRGGTSSLMGPVLEPVTQPPAAAATARVDAALRLLLGASAPASRGPWRPPVPGGSRLRPVLPRVKRARRHRHASAFSHVTAALAISHRDELARARRPSCAVSSVSRFPFRIRLVVVARNVPPAQHAVEAGRPAGVGRGSRS